MSAAAFRLPIIITIAHQYVWHLLCITQQTPLVVFLTMLHCTTMLTACRSLLAQTRQWLTQQHSVARAWCRTLYMCFVQLECRL